MVLSYSLREEILRARLSLMRASRSVRMRRSFWILAARVGQNEQAAQRAAQACSDAGEGHSKPLEEAPFLQVCASQTPKKISLCAGSSGFLQQKCFHAPSFSKQRAGTVLLQEAGGSLPNLASV